MFYKIICDETDLFYCWHIIKITTPLIKIALELFFCNCIASRQFPFIEWRHHSNRSQALSEVVTTIGSRKLSKTSTLSVDETLCSWGSRSHRNIIMTQACHFFLQWEWKGCCGPCGDVPREGAQLHIAFPHWAETHTHFCLTRVDLFNKYSTNGCQSPIVVESSVNINVVISSETQVFSGWLTKFSKQESTKSLQTTFLIQLNKNGSSCSSSEKPRNVRHQKIIQHWGKLQYLLKKTLN